MNHLYVKKSKIEGKGIHTAEAFEKGKKIAYIIGERVLFESKNEREAQSIPTWYGVSKRVWIDPGDSIFRFLNHSCNPNAAIVGTKTLIARRDIEKDEEITIDYSMTDSDENWTLEYRCRCKSKNCRKIIKSIQSLPVSTVRTHMPLIPKYFINLYRRSHPSVKI